MTKHLEIVGTTEIAAMFGVTKQVIFNWRNRHPDFPKPVAELAMGSIFNKKDVERWGNSRKKEISK